MEAWSVNPWTTEGVPQTGVFLLRGGASGKASLVAQTVKSLPAVRETGVRALCREDPLEKEMATHSSNLSWRIPRDS